MQLNAVRSKNDRSRPSWGKNRTPILQKGSHLQLCHSSLWSETRLLALDWVRMQSFPCQQRPDLVIDTQRFQLLLCRFSVSTNRKVSQDYCRLAEPCKHHRCCTRTSADPALLDAGERLNYHRCSSRGGNVNMRQTSRQCCVSPFIQTSRPLAT